MSTNKTININLQHLPSDIIIEVCKDLNVIDINSLYGTCSKLNKHIDYESKYIYIKCRHIQPHGNFKSWWLKNHIPKSKSSFIEGKKQGECKQWYCQFPLQLSRHCFYRDGELDGECREWYEKGQICEHFFYRDGKLDGEYKKWFSNGNIAEHCFYQDGKLDGEYKKWFRNGNI